MLYVLKRGIHLNMYIILWNEIEVSASVNAFKVYFKTKIQKVMFNFNKYALERK